MKNILKKTILMTSLILGSAIASANPAAPLGATIAQSTVKATDSSKTIESLEKAIKASAIAQNPAFKINSITQVPNVPSLYEVIHNRNNIFYITADGSHIIDGSVISLKDMTNLTAEKKLEISAIKFKDLPKNPIILKNGTGVNKIAVFSDPTCPHCKNLEPELQKLKDVTISLYVLPILSEASQTLAENILCSKKPGESWSKWMLEGKKPEEKTCSNGAKNINTNLNFAKEYEINGTPTIIFENGEVVKGSHPASKIQEYFTVLKEKEQDSKKK